MRTDDERSRPPGPAAVDDEPFVARLLAEAGPPPPAPELEIARIEEAARAEWRRRYAWHRRERIARTWRWAAAAVAAMAVAALALGLLVPGRGVGPATVIAEVERLAGEAEVVADGRSRTLTAGAALEAGAAVRTGDGALVALALADGRALRLDGASEVTIVAADRFELARGAVYLDSRGAPAATAPRIATALGTFRELGTRFEVRLDAGEPPAARLRVREGAVVWRENGRSAEAGAGTELSIGADGSLARGTVAGYGEPWQWTLAATPLPAVDGWTLARFLDWYGRESGLEVVYADAAAATLAGEVVLRGSLARLAPPEAVDAALASSGFEARTEGARLVVTAQSPER